TTAPTPAGCSKGRSELPHAQPDDRLGEAPFGAGGWPQPPSNTEAQARKAPLRAEAFRQPPHLRAARKAAASRRRARRPARLGEASAGSRGLAAAPQITPKSKRAKARYERRPFDSPHTCGLLERPQRAAAARETCQLARPKVVRKG